MPTSTPRGNASVAERPAFRSPVSPGAHRRCPTLALVDETASAVIVVKGVESGVTVPFGTAHRRADGILVCGSRPGEWTLLGPSGRDLAAAVGVEPGPAVAVVDLTHGRARFRLSGTDAAAALAKVCSVDLADDMTPDGAVVSGSVAEVVCDIVRDDVDGPSYLLLCDRSYGAYLFDALVDAGREFGLPAAGSA